MQEAFGLEGDRVWTAASGFGGGVARHQSICGALAGAVIGMGLLDGRSAQDVGPKKVSDALRPKARRLLDGFRETFGAIECRSLTRYDFNTPGGYEAFSKDRDEKRKCSGYVRYAVETVLKGFGE